MVQVLILNITKYYVVAKQFKATCKIHSRDNTFKTDKYIKHKQN